MAARSALRTRASSAVPALPGATTTASTCAEAAHFQASACSRPPAPTIRCASVSKMPHAVNTIAMPYSLAAWMTSLSRIEPPGWITRARPGAAAASMLSRKGTKASDASTELRCRGFHRRLSGTAMRVACHAARLTRADPPIVASSRANTMAFDLTNLHTRQAKRRSRLHSRCGARCVTTLRCAHPGAAITRLGKEASLRCSIFERARWGVV